MKPPKRSIAGPAGRVPAPPSPAAADRLAGAVRETRAWLEQAVIGLGLCPFARPVESAGRTRCVGSAATTPEALLDDFCAELRHLVAVPAAEVETTLLVHPFVLDDFADYNDFLDVVDAAVDALGCTGVVQVASFHPDYRFAGSAADDVTNATNRSPHPLLQLLREASVERAVAAFGDTSAIYARNLETMRTLGAAGWSRLQDACRRDARTGGGAAAHATPPHADGAVLDEPTADPALTASSPAPR